MFQTLIESRAARTRSIGGSMVSIAAHAGIVGALVIATAQATVAHVVEQRETAVKFTDVAPPTNLDNFTGIGKPGGRADGLEGATGVAPALNGVFLESEVEKPVVVLSGTAGPAYPESLRAAGIEGQVMAQFVVDSAGRVELATERTVSARSAGLASGA